MKIGIEALVADFPETIVRREDFSFLDPYIPSNMKEFLRGPDEVRRIKDEDGAEIMAERVVKKVLDRAGLTPSDIDYIICSNFGGKYYVPLIGGFIHHKFGFPETTPVLNIHNCCASFVDGLNNAWHLVKSGEYKRILVAMTTTWDVKGEGVFDPTDPQTILFGDGAGAAIVSTQNLKCEFLSYYSRTFGEIYDHVTARLKRVENPELMERAGTKATCGNYTVIDEWVLEWMRTTGGERFGIDGIMKALKKANLNLSDIDMVFYHQGGALSDVWKDGALDAGLSRDKWKDTFSTHGNMGNIDIGANLATFADNGKIPENSVIALFGFGGGGHQPTMIIRWLGDKHQG